MAKIILVLIGITLVALAWRLALLDRIPPGLYVDEASQGYNAYSLAQTGRDEYGMPLPIYLRAFGTYTPALAAYFLAVPMKFWGPGIWSLRLAPVIWGTLTVVAISLLAGYYFPQKRWLAMLLGGLTAALLPSHVLWSRAFYEPTVGLLLFTLGFFKLLRGKFVSAALLLSLSTYAYQSQRLVVYVFLAGWWWLHRKQFKLSQLWPAGILFVVTQLPQLYLSTLPGPTIRVRGLTWLSNLPAANPVEYALLVVKEFLSQYAAYFSPRNLFWASDPDLQRSLPEISILFPWQIVPWILGLVTIFRNFNYRNKILILLLVISPLAAALTKDPFSTVRASLLVVPLALIIGGGLVQIGSRLKPALAIVLLIGVGMLSAGHLYRSLFVLLPNERYEVWAEGYPELLTKIHSSHTPTIVDVDKPVYILYLFYNRVDPRQVQAQFTGSLANYYFLTNWENYYVDSHVQFRQLNWKADVCIDQLLVGSPLLISTTQAREHFLSQDMEITSRLGTPLLIGYRTHPRLKC